MVRRNFDEVFIKKNNEIFMLQAFLTKNSMLSIKFLFLGYVKK